MTGEDVQALVARLFARALVFDGKAPRTAQLLRDSGRALERLASVTPGTCSTCRFWERQHGRDFGDCVHEDVRDQCDQPPFWPKETFSCKFHTPHALPTGAATGEQG
jgi:hypothetical protein